MMCKIKPKKQRIETNDHVNGGHIHKYDRFKCSKNPCWKKPIFSTMMKSMAQKRKMKTWVRILFPPYSPNRTMEPAPAKIVEIEKGINEMFLNSQPALLSKLANIRCGWHRMETILQWFGFYLLVGNAGGAADGLHDNGPLCGSIDSL